MKAGSLDGTAKGKSVETTVRNIEEVEDVIAPGTYLNHNETPVNLDEEIRLKDERRKEIKGADVSDRRNFLKVAGAGLVAASAPSLAAGALKGAQSKEEELTNGRPRLVYLYGCGWNRELPGLFGEMCLTFDMRAELGGTGLGTFRDDVRPEINSQFQINSATRRRDVYTFEGEIIASRRRDMVGMRVRIVAESLGDGKGRATITVGTEETDLVVIAIIAILIGMLLPAV